MTTDRLVTTAKDRVALQCSDHEFMKNASWEVHGGLQTTVD